MTHITTDDEEGPLRKLAYIIGAENILNMPEAEMYSKGAHGIYLNGTIIGITRFPRHFVSSFRKIRRSGKISEFVSIFIGERNSAVQIASDGGRICRPLIVVENGRPKTTERALKVFLLLETSFDHSC